jgi:hypothetical protein
MILHVNKIKTVHKEKQWGSIKQLKALAPTTQHAPLCLEVKSSSTIIKSPDISEFIINMNIRLRLFRRHKILCALHVCAFLGFFLMYNAPLDSNDFNVAIDAPTARVNGTTHLNTSLVISERANPIFILHVGPPKTGSTTL